MTKEQGARRLYGMAPLLIWVLAIGGLVAYKKHQVLSAHTRLRFSVTVEGKQPLSETTARLDGKSILSGQTVRIGSHKLTVENAKAETFSTNFFVWYGEHNLGEIRLNRAKGALRIQANPPAETISISGPEFSVRLHNSDGTNITVPTDIYRVVAEYSHWKSLQKATVNPSAMAICTFEPKLGALRLTGNRDGSTYKLEDLENRAVAQGELPCLIKEIPDGDFFLLASHGGNSIRQRVKVLEGATNDYNVEFLYGATTLNTRPLGANVSDEDGKLLGPTPLTVTDLVPGMRRFTIVMDGYAPVTASMQVNANQTNEFETNLVNMHYTEALQNAHNALSSGQYSPAVDFAKTALRYESDDAEAKSIMRQATGLNYFSQAKLKAAAGDLVGGIEALKTALESIPDNNEVQQLLDDYTARKQQSDEEFARNAESQKEAEERKHKIASAHSMLQTESRRHDKADSFKQYGIIARIGVKRAGDAINTALQEWEPKHQVIRYDSTRPDTFIIETKQTVEDGSRECVILGQTISSTEILVCFKVLEYQTSHSISLGGILAATVVTQSDQNGERATRFEARKKEGVSVVMKRLRDALERLKGGNK